MTRARATGILVGATVSLLLWRAAFASVVTLDRTQVLLSPQAKTALVTLRNKGTEPTRFEVKVFAWDEGDNGEARLTPTTDIVVFPTLLELKIGEERKIRVGTTVAFTNVEQTYRLFIEELPSIAAPSPAKPGGAQSVAMRVRLGLPVFLAPARPVAKVEQTDLTIRNGAFNLGVRNTGNVHVVAQNGTFRGVDSRGRQSFAYPLRGDYILAGKTRIFTAPVSAAECRSTTSTTVTISANGHSLTQTAPVSSAACADGR
jgi:fimbrial chaperone protein